MEVKVNCDCTAPHLNTFVASAKLSRSEALQMFLRLQAEGMSPLMCEGRDGLYRVCYCGQAKPSAVARQGELPGRWALAAA